MSYRFMRMLIFFDLPVETPQQKREYTKFRKYLIKSGFMMMQESVYCKLVQNSGVVYCKIVLNQTVLSSVGNGLRKNKPEQGLIQMLTVTEKQFEKMEFLLGDSRGDIINTDERFIEL